MPSSLETNMKIAITGGVGSGKSTIVEALKKELKRTWNGELAGDVAGLNGVFRFFSVDELVHDTWRSIEDACKRQTELYYKLEDGSDLKINRAVLDEKFGQPGLYTQKAVSDFVWAAPENRKKVEDLISPIISAALTNVLMEPFVIVEFPTLFEKGDPRKFDLVINVSADEDLRRERAMKRSSWSLEKVNSVIDAQTPDRSKPLIMSRLGMIDQFIRVINEPDNHSKAQFSVSYGMDPYGRGYSLYAGDDFDYMISMLANEIKKRSVPFLADAGKKIGIIAGSFDPVTNGHIWMFKEALSVMDHVIVLSAHNPKKTYFFDEWQRVRVIARSISEFDQEFKSRVHVVTLASDELVIRYAENVKAHAIFRGIRNPADLQDESTQLAVQRAIAPKINIFYMIPPQELTAVSSSLVKGMLGLKEWKTLITPYVSTPVLKEISKKLAYDAMMSKNRGDVL